MSKFSFFIGCDISKSFFDVSHLEDGPAIYLGRFDNDIKGYLTLIKSLRKVTNISIDKWVICFENTGCYSKPLLKWLHTYGINCIEENPLRISRSLGLRRGKSDKIDSLDICRYLIEKQDILALTQPLDLTITKLKKFLSRRDFLVRQRSALKVSLKEQKGFIDSELYNELKDDNDLLIAEYDRQIKELESKIDTTVLQDKAIAKSYKLIRSVIGIGRITGAYLIATTNNFESFTCSRKYASYCGIAPFPRSSGKKIGRNKVSHMANKKIKSLLSNCILLSIRHDPQLASYYQRKLEEGKETGIVLNAVKNKIIQRVFAVVKRQTPYVKLNTYG